jgi:antirestriction protein ArdC
MSEKMTAAQATTFENGPSMVNTAILYDVADAKGCTCEPYIDWFTYKRWLAQGMQVQRGEKGTKLTTWISYEKEVDGKVVTKSRPRTTSVFCRCQVKAKGE